MATEAAIDEMLRYISTHGHFNKFFRRVGGPEEDLFAPTDEFDETLKTGLAKCYGAPPYHGGLVYCPYFSLADAIQQHDAKLMDFFLQMRPDALDDVKCSYAAASEGNIEYLKLIRENKKVWTSALCEVAACSGQLATLRFLRENGCPWDEETSREAALQTNPALLRWVYEEKCPRAHENLSSVSRKCIPEFVAFACEKKFNITEKVFGRIVSRGHDECIRNVVAAAIGTPIYKRLCTIAAGCRDALKAMKILHELGCAWDAETMAAAAGAINCCEMVKFLHENGCPWDARTTLALLKNIETRALRYALSNGCAVNIDECLKCDDVSHGARDILSRLRI